MLETSDSLPDLDQLLRLEIDASKNGSGICLDSLNGDWKFISVFKKGIDKEDNFSSCSLRFLSAILAFNIIDGSEDGLPIEISNSVKLGLVKLEFKGQGQLSGIQPILRFFFDSLEIRFLEKVVWRKNIDITEEKDRPFFALIAMDTSSTWLAARGRGGGLAIWAKA